MNEIEEKGGSEPRKGVEIKIYDEWGERSVEVLPKDRIIKKLVEIDDNLEAYMRMIWREHYPAVVDTDAVLDLTRGVVVYNHHLPSSTEFPFDAALKLWTIPQKMEEWVSPYSLLNEEESEEALKMLRRGEIEELNEYPEKKGLDLSDRYARVLTRNIKVFDLGWYFLEHFDQINEIYESGIDRRDEEIE